MERRKYKVKSKIHTCTTPGCNVKFIWIREELEMGYIRTKCPKCERYRHSGYRLKVTHYGSCFRDDEVLNKKDIFIGDVV